jgi:hypothetical protein
MKTSIWTQSRSFLWVKQKNKNFKNFSKQKSQQLKEHELNLIGKKKKEDEITKQNQFKKRFQIKTCQWQKKLTIKKKMD